MIGILYNFIRIWLSRHAFVRFFTRYPGGFVFHQTGIFTAKRCQPPANDVLMCVVEYKSGQGSDTAGYFIMH